MFRGQIIGEGSSDPRFGVGNGGFEARIIEHRHRLVADLLRLRLVPGADEDFDQRPVSPTNLSSAHFFIRAASSGRGAGTGGGKGRAGSRPLGGRPDPRGRVPADGTKLRLAATRRCSSPSTSPPAAVCASPRARDEAVIAAPLADGRVRLVDGRVARRRPVADRRARRPRRAARPGRRGSRRGLRDPARRAAPVALREPTASARSSAGASVSSRTSSTWPSAQRRPDPVRWLLADEVGLGKTVEACLILNHLVRTRRAERSSWSRPRR